MSDDLIRRVIDGVMQGLVTKAEADYILRKERNTRLDQALESYLQTTMPQVTAPTQIPTVGVTPDAISGPRQGPDAGKALPILAGIIFTAVLIGLVFYLGGGPTGLVVLNLPTENVTNATYAVDQNITGLNISGVLYGEGNASVWFDTPSGTLLAGSVTSDTGTPRTDKAGYAADESISVEHAPADATYYFDDGSASATVTPPFPATTNGTLLIVANESGTLTTYRLPIIIGDVLRAVAFADTCIETCAFAPTTGVIRIETQGDAQLELTSVHAGIEQANVPPELAMPFIPVTVESQTIVNLSGHFTDANDDTLYYSTSASDIVDARIEGDLLILTPLRTDTETLSIYASDLRDVARTTIDITSIAQEANITTNETTITENATANATENITTNATLNLTENATINATLNETNVSITINGSVDCNNPNPNLRPLECLLNSTQNYFLNQEIYWYDSTRTPVARFTPIGNMLVTGEVIENSDGAPPQGAYSIGYADDNLDIVPTIWVDQDGNLHLRGRLYEENNNLEPPTNTYSFNNRKGITLAYADLHSGDLHLRGNVIPYRKALG
jgi:hypothetical protein